MKKLLFLSLILGIIISLSSLSAKGQDTVEISWAKHIKQALENRPNPNEFSENEAWEVLAGKKPVSQDFITKTYKHKYFGFYAKRAESTVFYSRSSTSSIDGWWYTNTKKYKEYDWYFNFPLLKCIFILITISILLNYFLFTGIWLIFKILGSVFLSTFISFIIEGTLNLWMNNLDLKLFFYYLIGVNILIAIMFKIFKK